MGNKCFDVLFQGEAHRRQITEEKYLALEQRVREKGKTIFNLSFR